MKKPAALAALLAFVSVSCWHLAMAQTPQLQGGVETDETQPTTAQIQTTQTDCQSAPYNTSNFCIALSLQISGMNRDTGCLPIIVAGVADMIEYEAQLKTEGGSTGSAAAQITALMNQVANALGARGCLNPAPGPPTPPTIAGPTLSGLTSCQQYWNTWYGTEIGHCNATTDASTCIAQADATVKSGIANCTEQPAAQKQPAPPPQRTAQPPPKSSTPAPQPCKNQTGTATTDDLVTALYKFYRSQQFTKWGAAYMVGSMLLESKLDPAVNQLGGGPGYGLGQWTNVAPYTSYTALQCYAQAHGTPVSDFVTQAHFAVQQRPNVTNLFKTAQNAQQAQNAVTQFENYKVLGDRFTLGAAICNNVVCTQAPPSKFYDDPKVGVPAGTGMGVNVSKALGTGANLFNLIQSLQCSWTEPANLKASMAACMAKAGSK